MKKGKMLRDDGKDFKEGLFILNYLLKSMLTIKRNFGHSTDQIMRGHFLQINTLFV